MLTRHPARRTPIARALPAAWTGVLAVLSVALTAACADERPTRRPSAAHAVRSVAGARDQFVRRRVLVGHSVLGRPIIAVELGDPDERASLVVGVIHGDETAGHSIAGDLERGNLPHASALWVIEDLNPDGVAHHTRQNAHLVDLNRNFPWGWQRLGHPGDRQYSGPRPLSEPESRAAHRLILNIHPSVTVWLHQPLGVTDRSGGDPRIERRFASLSGLPLRQLPRYPGSAASWQNRRLPGTTAFVVELPPGPARSGTVARYLRAIRSVAVTSRKRRSG